MTLPRLATAWLCATTTAWLCATTTGLRHCDWAASGTAALGLRLRCCDCPSATLLLATALLRKLRFCDDCATTRQYDCASAAKFQLLSFCECA